MVQEKNKPTEQPTPSEPEREPSEPPEHPEPPPDTAEFEKRGGGDWGGPKRL